ncbi:hypothetical protein DZG01_28215 [Pseudomonas fluorescens]|nr:hypothetical protein DZG01_28215 [Pseudomonas fluorescens]
MPWIGIKIVKTKHSLWSYLMSLSTTLLIGSYNLFANYTNNLYPAEHDIIAIPFAAMIGTLLTLLLLLLFQHPYRLRKANNAPNTLLTKSASVLATTVTVILLLEHILYWSTPKHLPTFWIFLTTLCFYIHYQLQLYGFIRADINH